MFDLVIKNGWVIDPSARISSRLNLGVKSGRIASLTRGEISGSTVIDAEGLIVAPGFIDMHIHEDPYDAGEDRFQYLSSTPC
jgi:N-acyl-D-aspartate/D-glutamate deacylase